jgi:hypothetical protein
MITGELKGQIDRIWDAFWSGGISNPLEVMEQITYLLFLRRLDELQTLEEHRVARLGGPMERRIFPEGEDGRGRPYEQYRWSRFKHLEAREMATVCLPSLRCLPSHSLACSGVQNLCSTRIRDSRARFPGDCSALRSGGLMMRHKVS